MNLKPFNPINSASFNRTQVNNTKGKRHPTLGNHVSIAGGVRILGPIKIGNNTQIGPDCIIKANIEENSVVKKVTTLKIEKILEKNSKYDKNTNNRK